MTTTLVKGFKVRVLMFEFPGEITHFIPGASPGSVMGILGIFVL